jgi:hypothetical protein
MGEAARRKKSNIDIIIYSKMDKLNRFTHLLKRINGTIPIDHINKYAKNRGLKK